MTNLIEQLQLIERAQEDIYFARLDRELIAALHAQSLHATQNRREELQESAPARTTEIPQP
jgi:hypothetical protein